MTKNVKKYIISTILVIIFSLSVYVIPVSAKSNQVIIGGESFGLKLYCKGVMVTNFESFESNGISVCPGKKAGLNKSDIITKINDTAIKNNEQMNNTIKNSNGQSLKLTVERNEKVFNTSLKPLKDENGEYYAGIWIRDSCAGIGTISYYDASNNIYGALGHGICDIDTGGLMISNTGEILNASITSVTKSTNNNIGTLNGYFLDTTIGTIDNNCNFGIYGEIVEKPNKSEKFKIADKDEVTTGKATMYSTISGTEPKAYSIEIVQICNKEENSNRNFVIKVTDKRLLEETGGIVQGMSGSPIVQDGKFAGALTHVFVENCTQGYGILAENMTNKS